MARPLYGPFLHNYRQQMTQWSALILYGSFLHKFSFLAANDPIPRPLYGSFLHKYSLATNDP